MRSLKSLWEPALFKTRRGNEPTRVVIGIHPDRCGDESYSDKWAQWLTSHGVTVRILDLLADDAIEQAAKCDGVMWRWIHTWQFKQSAGSILNAIEHGLGIPVYPNSQTTWHYDEKVSQAYLLKSLQAPAPRTWVFWNSESALDWAKSVPYPVVFKLSVGAGSSNVLLINSYEEAASLICRMFNGGIYPYTMNEFQTANGGPCAPHWKPEFDYAYFQEFVANNSYDTRITVIGGRAFGFLRYNRPGDFRASGSGLVEYDMAKVDRRCVDMAFELSRRCGWQSMAYDFLFKDGRPIINEISYTFWDEAVAKCPGHWRRDGSTVNCSMWPEHAIVEDFLTQVLAFKSHRKTP